MMTDNRSGRTIWSARRCFMCGNPRPIKCCTNTGGTNLQPKIMNPRVGAVLHDAKGAVPDGV